MCCINGFLEVVIVFLFIGMIKDENLLLVFKNGFFIFYLFLNIFYIFNKDFNKF